MQKLLWLAALCAPLAVASAATYTLKPISLPGLTNVQVTAANDFGAIAGTASSGNGNVAFLRSGHRLTILPPFQAGAMATVVPTSLNNSGTLIGVASPLSADRYAVVFQHGTFVTSFDLGYGNVGPITPPVIAGKGEIAYNVYTPFPAPFAGPFANPAPVGAPNYSDVWSINASGQVAGVTFSFNSQMYTGFVGPIGGPFSTILPPGATNVLAAYINASGQVAGYFQGPGFNSQTGYLYSSGNYTTFSSSTTSSITVTGIDDGGDVFGTYGDSNSTYPFIFKSGTITPLASFPVVDSVSLATSPHGKQIVVSVAGAQETNAYEVRCSGTDCP